MGILEEPFSPDCDAGSVRTEALLISSLKRKKKKKKRRCSRRRRKILAISFCIGFVVGGIVLWLILQLWK